MHMSINLYIYIGIYPFRYNISQGVFHEKRAWPMSKTRRGIHGGLAPNVGTVETGPGGKPDGTPRAPGRSLSWFMTIISWGVLLGFS